ncbi:class I SAM-dependent methyltransferase [Pseudobacteriovorax antillogorgiicola]|nr:methyltransferase domain-containing protein [Pseudobacteriovorax antillogorgiicola]
MRSRILRYYNDFAGRYQKVLPHKTDSWQFLQQFLSSPMQTGSIAPSSGLLAKAMSAGLWHYETGRHLVEYGPGTGALTKRIVHGMPSHSTYTAIEINPGFVESMGRKYPQIDTILGSAENVKALVPQADVVISGLPFFNLPSSFGHKVLEETHGVLAHDGFFRTFMYLPTYSSRKMRLWRAYAQELFPHIETTLVPVNFPPAVVVTLYKSKPVAKIEA